ncbi:serine palmitoyltransferase component, partial [Tulasnella sp. 418]
MELPSTAAHTSLSFLSKKKSTTSTYTATNTSIPALSYSSSVTEGYGNTPLEGCDFSDVEEDDESGLSRPRIPPNSMQPFNTRHVGFGHCADQRFRPFKEHVKVDPPHYILMLTYISYLILVLIGHMRDFFGK